MSAVNDNACLNRTHVIYKYHPVYGSPPVNKEANPIRGVKVSPDGLKVRIVVDKLRTFYIHELSLPGVRSATDSHPLLHPVAYYTLNAIPDGEALKVGEIIRATPEKENKGKSTLGASSATKSSKVQAEEVRELLAKNTCLACHETGKRKIGPAYTDVARRNYSNEQIVDLIYKPRAGNWPDYATEMPPMPQVPREEALKIAAWINSLKNQK